MKEMLLWFGTMIVVAALGALLGGGAERDYMLSANGDVMFAYGCGRHDATRTPNSDPLEYEGCEKVREKWYWTERWPRYEHDEPCADRKYPPQWCEGIR